MEVLSNLAKMMIDPYYNKFREQYSQNFSLETKTLIQLQFKDYSSNNL